MPWTAEQNGKFSQKLSEYWTAALKNKPGLGVAWIKLAKRFPYDVADKAVDAIWESQERQGFMPGPKRFLDEAMAIQRWAERCAPIVSLGGKDASGGPVITCRYYYATTFQNPEKYLPKDPVKRAARLAFMRRTSAAVMGGASLVDVLTGHVGKPEKDDEVPF